MRKILMCCIILGLLLTMCSCKQTNDAEEIITVFYNTKIEESIFHTPFLYQIPDGMKEKGFLSVEKKDDGLAVYEIKRKDYIAFMAEIESSRKEILDRYTTDYAPYVKSISYNDDLTEIIMAVNKTDYENMSKDNTFGYSELEACIIGCSRNVAVYHSFTTDDFKECEIKIVDSDTGDVLETIYTPASLLDN